MNQTVFRASLTERRNLANEHVSIVDLNPESCPGGLCQRLPNLLQECVPSESISIRRSLAVQRESHPFSKLILLRPSSKESVSELLHFLRRGSPGASVLGLFCAGWERSRDALRSLVRDFDDFLSCPFNEIDLSVRI